MTRPRSIPDGLVLEPSRGTVLPGAPAGGAAGGRDPGPALMRRAEWKRPVGVLLRVLGVTTEVGAD